MRKVLIISILCLLAASCAKQESMEVLTKRVFDLATEQFTAMSADLGETTTPRTIAADTLMTTSIKWWCSGFFPGSLWYVYEYNGSEAIKALAEKETMKIEPIKFVKHDHDVGFQINCSFGNGYRLTDNEYYKDVMHTAAQSLATRFNPNVGCTKSWNFVRPGRDWKFPVIIDNMMNMELLLSVAKLYDDAELKNIALSHARTTMKNHFREDYTTFHLVDYDPETGDVRKKHTVQGYADDSAWARGQAWALYGYTMLYDYTGESEFLAQAENIADMLIGKLPEDGIPYWDFNDPKIPDVLRDASAGAIMASAFVKLASFSSHKADYLTIAEKQLRSLASEEYLAKRGENCNFLLKHSVGNLPGKSEVDVPLTYADYYFLEALLRFRQK